MTKWRVVALCWGALVFTSMIRVSLGVAAPFIMEEFDIPPETMGWILSGWNWAYTACQLFVGPLVDRFGPWIVLGLGSGLWSLSTILLPLAGGAVALFSLRALFGIGHSPLIPAQASAISRSFQPDQRSTALGFSFSGSQLGSAAGAIVAGFILARWGWPSVFYAVGAGNLIFGLIWLMAYPDRKVRQQVKITPKTESQEGERVSIPALLGHRSAWGLAFGQMGYLYAYHVFLSWLPTYLVRERGMTIEIAGGLTGVLFIGGMIGTIGGGWLADYLVRRGISSTVAKKSVVGVGMMFATVMVVTAAYTSQTWLAVTLLTLCMTSLRATTGSANSMPIELAPSSSVASLVSIQNVGGNVGGLIAPIATGYILAVTGVMSGALVAAGAIMTFGAFSYVFIVGRLPDAETD